MPVSEKDLIVGVGKETTYGTAVAPTRYLLVEPGARFQTVHEAIEHRGLWGKESDLFKASKGPESTEFDFSVVPDGENLGEILKALLGTEVVTLIGGSAYKHEFTPQAGAQLPSLTFSVDRGITGAIEDYTGSLVKKLTIKGGDRGAVSASVSGIGQDAVARAALTPTLDAVRPFVFHDCSIDINGANNDVKEFEITLENDTEPKWGFRGGGTNTPASHFRGLIKATLKASLYHEDPAQTNLRADWRAATIRNFKVTAAADVISGADKYTLIVDLAKLLLKGVPFEGVDGALGVELSGEAQYDQANSRAVYVRLDNARSTAY